jgi:O-antigen/teichoic acid export membrane protein
MAKFSERLKNRHFLSLAGNVIMSFLGMLTIAILCRVLTLDGFGVWVFFQTVVLLLETFRSGFITTAFVKFYSGVNDQRAKDVEGSSWFISVVITASLTALNLLALPFLPLITNPSSLLIVKWFSLCFWVMLPHFLANCVLQATQRFDRLLVLRFVNQGSFIAGICICYFIGRINLQTVIISYIVSYVLSSGIALVMQWTRVKHLRHRTKETVAEIFHFGKYTLGTNIGSNLFKTSDTFIITFMLGPGALAIYNVGQRLMELVEIPLRSFTATAMPEMAVAYNEGNKPRLLAILKNYTGGLTLALIPACLIAIVLADVAIFLIGGAKYAGSDAANVFRLFMTFALLYPADRFFAVALDVIHRPKINTYKVIAMLAGNIVFDFVGIFIFHNIYGVALATVVPVLIGAIVGFRALNLYYARFSFLSVYQSGYRFIVNIVKSRKIQVTT